MRGTVEGLRELGVDARYWRPWEQALSEAGCLHLFGSSPEHLPLVESARRGNVPVVLSTIAWFDLAGYWHSQKTLARRLLAGGRFLARAGCPGLPSWRRRLYHEVDLLLPNSNAEAEQLVRYFGVPTQKIHVVPNGADERFAQPPDVSQYEPPRAPGFVLSVGRIEPRKNQLGLLRALRGTDVPVVVIGDTVPGHEDYATACRTIAGDNVQFLGRLDHDDPRLAAAYAGCGCLVLCGHFETPGLAALEAGMSGTPLVLPAAGAAGEYFGELADYVYANDPSGIRRAVLAAIQRQRNPQLAEHVRRNFSWKATARATREAYRKVLRRV